MGSSVLKNKIFKKPSFRGWLSIITTVLLLAVVFFAWPEILKAWGLMGSVNLWILALLIPVQVFSYYATGAIMFSYLRKKGNIKNVSHWRMTRIALELNFVNHVIPSGGAVGFSYLPWILKKDGVPVSRSTIAQIIRFTLTFVSFVLLLIVSLIILTFSYHVDRFMVGSAVGMTVLVIVAMALVLWLLRSRKRMDNFSIWLERFVNRMASFFTRGKKDNVLKAHVLADFFDGIHDDYVALRKDRKILVRPFIWATVANILDAALLWIAFAALGFNIDPALLFISYGLASIISAVAVTPGGAGVYEAVTVMFLSASGVSPDTAIAGTLLARVVLVVGTIIFGYFFYQNTVLSKGAPAVNKSAK